MGTTNISVERKAVVGVLDAVDERRFAIPRLQREFVWDGRKAAKLLDSIVQGMPIGMVMIWQTARSKRLLLRQHYHVLPPFDPRHSRIWFLIDGQQRISVLHHVRAGSVLENARRQEIDFKRVVLALDDDAEGDVVRYRKPVEGEFLSLCDLLGSSWRRRIGRLPPRKLARAEKARDSILSYRMYLMFLRTPVSHVREAFLRINTQGMKITAADAIFSRAEDLHLRDVYHEVRDALDDSFRDIEEAPILFAMLAARDNVEPRGEAMQRALRRLEKDVAADPRLRSSLERTWRELRDAFGKAVDYLRQNFRVVHLRFLYSEYMVAMLALFYFKNDGAGPNVFQREQIKRWFWATTVGSRYSGRNFNRYIRRDVDFFKHLARGDRKIFRYTPEVDRSDLRRAQYTSRTGITSAFYSLLLLRRPVRVMDDGLDDIPVERYAAASNRKDRHHIFPAALMSGLEASPRDYNSVANVCLLTAEENQGIGKRRPKEYLADARSNERIFRRKMERHYIPVGDDSGVWKADVLKGFRLFLRDRTNILCDAMEAQAGLRLFRREERRQSARHR